MFNKILIANRGEIALRIARTCRELGIKTVAIFSDIDKKAPFVHFCDEAYALDGITSLDTYLHIEKIIAICKKSNAEAVHPGYGFLAENADFVKACEDNGFTFNMGFQCLAAGIGIRAPNSFYYLQYNFIK